MRKKTKLNLKNVWDFFAWIIGLIASNQGKAVAIAIIIGLILGGYTIKTPFFSFEQKPVNVEIDGIGSINQK